MLGACDRAPQTPEEIAAERADDIRDRADDTADELEAQADRIRADAEREARRIEEAPRDPAP